MIIRVQKLLLTAWIILRRNCTLILLEVYKGNIYGVLWWMQLWAAAYFHEFSDMLSTLNPQLSCIGERLMKTQFYNFPSRGYVETFLAMARRSEQSMTFLIAMRTGPSWLLSPQKQRRKCFIEKHFDLQGSSFSIGDRSIMCREAITARVSLITHSMWQGSWDSCSAFHFPCSMP
jgi:hypothetical protein